MVSLELTKKALAWRAAFLREATEYLLAAGARPSPHANDFVLDTRAGPLSVSVYGNWLACRFADPALANALLASPESVGRGTQRLNPWSGKWNFHFAEATPVPHCLAEFAAELGPLLREGRAAAPAGVQDGLSEGCGRDAPEPPEEPPMKAHPEPLARLLLDRDYNALVRGNERRGDAVRAMAADDFAQEFLNDRGWAAYSLALELLGKHTSGGGSTRIDGRDVSLFAGGINAEPFRLEYGRVDAAPGTPPAATWATPPQSSTRSRSATNCGAAWGCTRRPS